jgi:acetylornithine deacetylase
MTENLSLSPSQGERIGPVSSSGNATGMIPETVVELLAQMISFDTVNEHVSLRVFPEKALLESLENTAQRWGLSTERLQISTSSGDEAFNLLITHVANENAPWLLFESHADTVSVEGMTIDPFNSLVANEKIYGRGSSDTKGSGAAMLWALRSYTHSLNQINNIGLLFVTDEENSKAGAIAFIEKQLPGLTWRPIGIIVGEATSCLPVVAHNGCIRWKIRTKGIAAHSSNPSLGKSAITSMAKLLLEFDELYTSTVNASHPLTGIAACSVNTISGGSAVNIIPDVCEIEIDRRVLPSEDSDKVKDEIKSVLSLISMNDPTIIIELSTPFVDYPLDPKVNHDFSLQISEVLEAARYSGAHRGAAYGTDASTYSEAGIPALVLGPGSIDQAHTKDEWLEIAELEKAVIIYGEIMRHGF